MRKLGISLYPGKSKEADDLKYIEKAHEYGFSRIFTNLLQITEENKSEILPSIKKIIQFAKSLNFEIFVDENKVFHFVLVSYLTR